MSAPALEIEGVSVIYANGFRALDEVSLMVGRDEALGVVGASGSGKTTLLRAIMGLLPPSARVRGRIVVDGTDLLSLSARERRRISGRVVGLVAQDPYAACDPLRRVRHHVVEAWAAQRMAVPDGIVDERLEAIGIPDPAERSRQRPHQWSGGMLQRATIVAATAHGPVLTLADEPTSALDADLADDALELLRAASSALVLVTHDLALAGRHTHRIVVLDGGRVVESGASGDVLAHPGHPTTKRLVEASTPSVWNADPGNSDSDPESVRGERRVVVAADEITKSYRTKSGQTLPAVRATSLRLHAGEVLGVIGPSGAGKSTLVRLLAGMERPDSGSLLAAGEVVWGASGRPRMPRPGFAMPIFQDPVASLDARWPLWRTVTEPLVIRRGRMARPARRRLTSEQFGRLGLDDIDVDRLPGSLSVGQCQRVAVLRALIADPSLLAADEPTASLDVESAQAVSELLRVAADRGTAVVVVSHDERRLRSYADRIMRMVDGELRANETRSR